MVIFLLSGVDVQLQLVWVDVVLHKIFPIVVVLDWIVDPPADPAVRPGGPPLARLPARLDRLTLVRGAADGWYPYPFLNPANGGYGQVAVDASSPVTLVGVRRDRGASDRSLIGNARGRATCSARPTPTPA